MSKGRTNIPRTSILYGKETSIIFKKDRYHVEQRHMSYMNRISHAKQTYVYSIRKRDVYHTLKRPTSYWTEKYVIYESHFTRKANVRLFYTEKRRLSYVKKTEIILNREICHIWIAFHTQSKRTSILYGKETFCIRKKDRHHIEQRNMSYMNRISHTKHTYFHRVQSWWAFDMCLSHTREKIHTEKRRISYVKRDVYHMAKGPVSCVKETHVKSWVICPTLKRRISYVKRDVYHKAKGPVSCIKKTHVKNWTMNPWIE